MYNLREISECLELHEIVKSSGKSNVSGLRIPLQTQWNIPFLREKLVGYEDEEVAEFIEFGWPINLQGEESFKQKRGKVRNWKGATEFPEFMEGYIRREVSEGTLLGGFNENPFSSQALCHPLNSTEKDGGKDRRTILDCSYPPGDALNERIPKDSYQGKAMTLTYPGIDDLVEIIKRKGRGCALMKVDLRRAYKQIFVDPGDWNLLGCYWAGKYFFDRTMPMGLRSAAMCCQRITNAFKFIVEKEGFDLVPYLDDMASAEVWSLAEKCYGTIRDTVKGSGAEESTGKNVPPTVTMTFLGILANSLTLTLEVPEERLCEIRELLEEWLQKTHITRKMVESMVGKLNFVAICVRPGRLFIARMLEFMRDLPQTGQYEVTDDFRKDLLWWRKFLPRYNGVSMMALEEWSAPDQIFATDACLTGYGCWYPERNEFIHNTFPSIVLEQQLSINALEMLTIMIGCKVWGRFWRGKRIVVHCDNETSVLCLNKGRAWDSFLLACLREIEMLAATHEFELRGNWIAGVENRIPDALSRWDTDPKYEREFYSLVSGLSVSETFAYEGLFNFDHEW